MSSLCSDCKVVYEVKLYDMWDKQLKIDSPDFDTEDEAIDWATEVIQHSVIEDGFYSQASIIKVVKPTYR